MPLQPEWNSGIGAPCIISIPTGIPAHTICGNPQGYGSNHILTEHTHRAPLPGTRYLVYDTTPNTHQ